MANTKKQKASELTGLFIYQEKKQTIYYDIFTKKGYVISNSDAAKYTTYSTRVPAALIIFIFGLMAFNNMVLFGLLAVGFLIVTEVLFRKNFLGSLPEIPNYKIKEESKAVSQYRNMDNKRLLLIVAMLIAAGSLVIVNNNINGFTGAVQIGNYIVAGASYVAAVWFTYIYLTKKNIEKK